MNVRTYLPCKNFSKYYTYLRMYIHVHSLFTYVAVKETTCRLYDMTK